MANTSKIILADDDPIMREVATAKLTEAGYDVCAVADGTEALAQLKNDGADLVISDLDMPVMSGFELTENIRADQLIEQTPVIVVTATDQTEAVDKAFAAGATSFLAKPINWTLFSQAVMFVLRASETQNELIAARDQAEAGANFKDGLMSVMSHELRTPLNAIIGFGQLLGEQFDNQNDKLHKEYADYIVDGGKRLLNSVSDMLLASDARSGPVTINETDTTVGDLIEQAVGSVHKSADFAGANIAVSVRDADMEIRCDAQSLSRAITKLLDNAIKFSPHGVKIVIGAAITKSGGLAILVKDDGPGVSQARLSEIAMPFSQSDMSTRRTKEGLGLGLPLAKSIADAHGATFKLTSIEGEGLSALIVLPQERVLSTTLAASNVA